VPKNIHAHPMEGHPKFQKGWGGGVPKAKNFKRQYETEMELPEGWVLVQTQTPFMVGY